MDLSGRTNVDLSEAGRLTKQSTASPTVSNPSQLQPPPLMMMQQAVAMQQFQFQQALLMQQVMATQQAAARAATVKSAAEIAAARAAEISKQLKGSDNTEEEEEKKPAAPSPSRSKSRSLSRSRSVSKSKSRSPIRYRRGRSLSRSPIRYRRDRGYSPSRSRDHYNYRSRSRRGYYRGRGDYYWSPFRRDWDRDRERDHHPRYRRSRSRSRDRVRRRSRSRSRTPRSRRNRSVSPRYRRDERKSTRSVKRSKSRDVRSESSRSVSPSPGRNESGTPTKRAQEGMSDAVRREDSGSPNPRDVERSGKEISLSPDHEDRIRSPESNGRGSVVDKEDRLKREDQQRSKLAKGHGSVSPPRSLSVSLDRSVGKDLESDDDVPVRSSGKKSSTSLQKIEYSDEVEPDHSHTSPSPDDVKAKASSSDADSDEHYVDSKLSGKLLGRPNRSVMDGRIAKSPEAVSEKSEDDDALDYQRSNVKILSRERAGWDEGKLHSERTVEERKPLRKEPIAVPSRGVPVHNEPVLAKETSKYSETNVERDVERADRRAWLGSGGKDFKRQESFRYRESSPLAAGKGNGSNLKDSGRHSGAILGREEILTHPPKVVVAHSDEEDPTPEAVDRPILVEDYKDTDSDGDKEIVTHSREKADSDEDDEAKVSRGKSGYDDDVHASRRSKEKRSRDRKLVDEDERERRRDRHRRHRKKHRKDDDDQDDDDDDGESRRERRRHRKKHRRDDDDGRKEKRKKRHKSHKSRGKSVSDSAGDSPRAEADASREENDGTPVRKKVSSKHRKRRREPSRTPINSDSSSE